MISKIHSNYFKNHLQEVREILSNYFKNQTREPRESLIYFKNKTKQSRGYFKLLQKPHTRDPQDYFKLLKNQKQEVPENLSDYFFRQNTRRFRDAFKLVHIHRNIPEMFSNYFKEKKHHGQGRIRTSRNRTLSRYIFSRKFTDILSS